MQFGPPPFLLLIVVPGNTNTAEETISYFVVSLQIEWRRESGQSGAGYAWAAGSVQNKASGSALGGSFKSDLVTFLREKVLLTFGKHFKLRRCDALCEGLCEEAVAVASDFENQV